MLQDFAQPFWGHYVLNGSSILFHFQVSTIDCLYVSIMASLAKWLSVKLRTKWLWIRIQLQSPWFLLKILLQVLL